MDLAMVPAAPPAWKKYLATSCPAPISANAPYILSLRLITNLNKTLTVEIQKRF